MLTYAVSRLAAKFKIHRMSEVASLAIWSVKRVGNQVRDGGKVRESKTNLPLIPRKLLILEDADSAQGAKSAISATCTQHGRDGAIPLFRRICDTIRAICGRWIAFRFVVLDSSSSFCCFNRCRTPSGNVTSEGKSGSLT